MSCDFDPATVYHKATVRAAKNHACCECHGIIARGEHHERVKGLWDDQWTTFRTCPDCVFLRCEVRRDQSMDCGWLHGSMLEVIESYADRTSRDTRAARIVAMFNATAPLRGARRIERVA